MTASLLVVVGGFAGSGRAVGGMNIAGHPARVTSTSETVVLGSKNFAPNGIGWGTAHPRVIFNGGDPNGKAIHLTWRSWGRSSTSAHGLTYLFRPGGGYYSKPGAIVLLAYGIGRCSPGGPRAYLHLRAREASRPGGPYGPWFAWGGQRNLCRWS